MHELPFACLVIHLAYVGLMTFIREDTSELHQDILGLEPSIIQEIIRSANQLGIAALLALEKIYVIQASS